MNTTSRRYCFTSFDIPTNTETDLADAFQASTIVKYAVWQIEIAPTTNKRHVQGYVVFSNAVRGSKLKGLHPSLKNAHLEKAKGSDEACVAYCTKPESRESGPHHFGDRELVGKGRRTDILGLKASIDNGDSMAKIWDDHPELALRYFSAIGKIKLLKEKPRCEQTDLVYVFGPSGFGKTTWVSDQAGDGPYFKDRSKWWDGYDGKADVVLDDFFGWIKFDELLRLGNAHGYRVESKGSTINFDSRTVWITSNHQPDELYRGVPDTLPFLRRLSKIVLFTAYKELRIWTTGDRSDPSTWAWTQFKESDSYSRPVIIPGKHLGAAFPENSQLFVSDY